MTDREEIEILKNEISPLAEQLLTDLSFILCVLVIFL